MKMQVSATKPSASSRSGLHFPWMGQGLWVGESLLIWFSQTVGRWFDSTRRGVSRHNRPA